MIPLGMFGQDSLPPTGFITRWTVAGDATARTITLPLPSTRTEGPLAYNCTVDWGDGSPHSTVTAYNDPNRVHTYAANGTYDVEIRGTCEGWSFNFSGDRLKVVAIVKWGSASLFDGFKFLVGGFYGCTNLTSIAAGPIPASGTGIGAQGFNTTFSGCHMPSVSADLFSLHTSVTLHAFDATFNSCSMLTSVPAGLFAHATLASDYAFNNCFANCSSLAAIPAHLFDPCTAAAVNGFTGCFQSCILITAIPVDLFRYCTLVTTNAFNSTFYGCHGLVTIPTDLFRYCTLASANAFQQTFRECSSLVVIPADLFRYNTLVTTNAFRSCFYACTSLTTVPADLFRYCTAVTDYAFRSVFNLCSSLSSLPADLFRYNTAAVVGAFQYALQDCVKLQVNKNLFYADGEQATRFLNQSVDFTNCFDRLSFSGVQGTAPDLWNCNFGTGAPVKSLCYGDAGNSLTSLDNYADIPAAWRT